MLFHGGAFLGGWRWGRNKSSRAAGRGAESPRPRPRTRGPQTVGEGLSPGSCWFFWGVNLSQCRQAVN
ncbi:hypothetical protein Hsc_2300 [Herbaspirillum seropedicae]|nr:hypothetical protein Hsc_2300 [Herbaspirillum seropedicae]